LATGRSVEGANLPTIDRSTTSVAAITAGAHGP